MYKQVVSLKDMEDLPPGSVIRVRDNLYSRYRSCTKEADGRWTLIFANIKAHHTLTAPVIHKMFIDMVTEWADV